MAGIYLTCCWRFDCTSSIVMRDQQAAAAFALFLDLDPMEEACAGLARRHLVRPVRMARWPDGTLATCYAFMHALYQRGKSSCWTGFAGQSMVMDMLAERGPILLGGVKESSRRD
jgi:hypothetical protein